jgi:hypothetical protein
MKLFTLLLCFIFNIPIFSQSFESIEKIKEEARNRQLSHIKSCIQNEYSYSFGKRNEDGEKIEYTEYNKYGYELIKKSFDKELVQSYSEFEYDVNNNPIIFSEYDSDNNLVKKRINKYDNNLLHIESVNYNSTGEIDYKEYYEYNSKKIMIGGKSIYDNGEIYSKWQFKYKDEHLIEEIFYNSEGKIKSKSVYEYLNNKKSKEIEMKSDGAKIREVIYEYPQKNKIIAKTSYYILADPSVVIWSFILDKYGRTIESNSETKDGSTKKRIQYKYDKNGNPLEEIHYNSVNEPEKSIMFEYEYFFKE